MIRLAVAADSNRLMAMGRAFHQEAGYETEVPFCEQSFGKTTEALMVAGLLLVADKGDGAIAMAGADVAPSICNHKFLFSREAFWYVEPQHRQGLGRQILTSLERVVTLYGAHFFDVVAETGKRSDALGRLYRAAGYSSAEITYRKKLS